MKKSAIFKQLALGYGVVSASNLFFPAIYVYSFIMMNSFGAVEYHELKNELKLDLLPFLKIYFKFLFLNSKISSIPNPERYLSAARYLEYLNCQQFPAGSLYIRISKSVKK